MVTAAGRTPLIVAAAASVVTVLAFFAMPLISFGPFKLTGAEVAGAPDTLGSDAAALGLLWLVPLAAAAAAVVAATQLLGAARTGAGRATLVAVLAGAAVLVYVIALGMVLSEAGRAGASDQAFSIIGAGFWVGVLAAVVAVGAALSAARSPSGPR